MSIKANLTAAKALIDTPEKWIKGNLQNADETCFCAYGATAHIARSVRDRNMDHSLVVSLRAALPKGFVPDRRGIMDIAQFNDRPSTTHADIMALFDRAIAAQGEDE